MLLAAFFAALPIGAAPANPVPVFPVGFERVVGSGAVDTYDAQYFGSAIRIDPASASIRTGVTNLRISAVGANPHSVLSAQGNAGKISRMIGPDQARWTIDAPLFTRVRNAEIYPGIELDWHASARHLEYDFLVAAYSNPEQIQLRIDGASGLALNTSGDLVMSTPDGDWIAHKPVTYQQVKGARRNIPSRFILDQNTIRFALGTYDRSLPLTIDPSLSYSTYLGGSNTDEAHAIGLDGKGNIFVAGLTYSTSVGNSNLFLIEVPPSGVPSVIVYGGTDGNDTANAIAVDAAGDFFVVGSTTSPNFPVIVPSSVTSIQSNPNEFGLQKAIAVAFAAGVSTPVWSEYFGGSESDEALGVTIGPNNLLYIVGDTDSTDFLSYSEYGALINTNDLQDLNGGGYDGYLLSMGTNGAFSFATYMGGPGNDYSTAVAVNSDSRIFVVGYTDSTNFNTGLAFQVGLAGEVNTFATSFAYDTSTGASSFYWITYIGGSGQDLAAALTLDADSNLYIAGTTTSINFPTSESAYQTTYQGGVSDGFVFVLDNNGYQGVWSTYLGSAADDALNAIALDSSGDVFVTGTTDSTAYPITTGAVQSTNSGEQDVTISELSSSGSVLMFSTYLGGTGNDIGRGIAVDASGNIYVAGISDSSGDDFPLTTGTFHQAYAGGTSDAFLSVIGCSGAAPTVAAGGVTNAASFLATAVAPGGIISVFGSDFACTGVGASVVPLATILSGVTVKVNGTAIPLYYAGATQINAQLPYEIPAGSATLTVTNAYGTSTAESFTVVPTGPGIFVSGTQAAALNYPGYTVNTTSNGAAPGSVVVLYLSGFGPVSPAIADGAAAPSSPLSTPTATMVSATINGQSAAVSLGMAPGFVGLGQANLVVPSGLAAGTYPVVITIGIVSSQPANITVSN